jgi:hypothetical protein
VFGETAMGVHADDRLTRAELFRASPAEAAFEAGAQLVTNTDTIARLHFGDATTGPVHDPYHLVARHQREARVAPVVLDHLEVASRDAPVRELHQHIVRPDVRSVGERDQGSALLRNRVGSNLHGRFDSDLVPTIVDPTAAPRSSVA